jgi:hypothetical protein
MRYFVLAPSGERFGPADVPTLNQWAADNRLFPESRLMEEMSGNVVAASSVPGLAFPQAAPSPLGYGAMQPPPPMQPIQPPAPGTPATNYPRPGQAFTPSLSSDNGVKDLWMAFGTAVGAPLLGFVTVYGIILAVAGIAASWRAIQKGQKLGILALILNIVAVGAAFYMRFILRYQMINHW